MLKKSLLIIIIVLLLVFLAACGGGKVIEVTATAKPTLDPSSPAGRGKMLFSTYCEICHAVDEDTVLVGLGPSLFGVSSRAASRVEGMDTEAYLTQSILYPNDYIIEGYEPQIMEQNFEAALTTEDVNHLIAYLLTLK